MASTGVVDNPLASDAPTATPSDETLRASDALTGDGDGRFPWTRRLLVVLGARFPIVGRVVISSLLFVVLVVGIVLVPKTMTGPSPQLGPWG